MKLLTFHRGNSKLSKKVWHTSLPSGFTCPFANLCLSKANRKTGKITDGQNTEIRCFSASQEALFPTVRNDRWNNFDLLRGLDFTGMYNLILLSLPEQAEIIRIHVAGDFFNQNHFNAWLAIAEDNPHILFYAYTKSIPFWLKHRENKILPPWSAGPDNFVLTASYGGRHDNLIELNQLKYSKIVFSKEEARQLGLKIDTTDGYAMKKSSGGFALLLHGVQPAGSQASKELQILKSQNEYGYGKKSAKRKEKKCSV